MKAGDTQNNSTFVKQHPLISKLGKNIIKISKKKKSPSGIICTFVNWYLPVSNSKTCLTEQRGESTPYQVMTKLICDIITVGTKETSVALMVPKKWNFISKMRRCNFHSA